MGYQKLIGEGLAELGLNGKVYKGKVQIYHDNSVGFSGRFMWAYDDLANICYYGGARGMSRVVHGASMLLFLRENEDSPYAVPRTVSVNIVESRNFKGNSILHFIIKRLRKTV